MSKMRVTRAFRVRTESPGNGLPRGGSAPATGTGRVPRLAKLMALAIRLDEFIRDGIVTDQAE
jgi:hypothetical protein